jgi:hypothetical protein
LSKNEPGQWISWDFHGIRIRPTAYSVRARNLKSWILEGSLDGSNWKEMDRETGNQEFSCPGYLGYPLASFHIPNPKQCRFIRLTQTEKNHDGDDSLSMCAVEFFGNVSE